MELEKRNSSSFFDYLQIMFTKNKFCKQRVLTELKSHVSITLQNKMYIKIKICKQNKKVLDLTLYLT